MNSTFLKLWTHVGVRQVFRVSDLVHRLNSLPTHRQLRHKELDFAVKLLCEIAEKADPECVFRAPIYDTIWIWLEYFRSQGVPILWSV